LSEDIISSLRRILEESENVAGLDEYVKLVADAGRRERFLAELKAIHNRILSLRLQKGPEISRFYLRTTRMEHNNRMKLAFAFEYFMGTISMTLTMNGLDGLASLDNLRVRVLLYDEYLQRYRLLEEKVLSGKLDTHLEYSAEIIIFSIMGFSDDFIFANLGIDPKKGETYTTFIEYINGKQNIIEVIKLKPQKSFEPFLNKLDLYSQSIDTKISNDPKPDSIVPSRDPVKLDFGFEVMLLTTNSIKYKSLPEGTTGVLVIHVVPDSPAERAGLRQSHMIIFIDGEKVGLGGDIIIQVDGLEVKTSEDLHSYLNQHHVAGQKIIFRILREGSQMDLTIEM
jgi:hypothetical protein